jgi:hypothetical protein
MEALDEELTGKQHDGTGVDQQLEEVAGDVGVQHEHEEACCDDDERHDVHVDVDEVPL